MRRSKNFDICFACPAQRSVLLTRILHLVRTRLSALSQAISLEYRGGRVFKACHQGREPQLQQREDDDGDDDTEDGWRERHCLPFHSFDGRSTSTCIGARTGHNCERRRGDINGKSARRRRDEDQARRQCAGQRGGKGAAFRHKGRFVPCHNRFAAARWQPEGNGDPHLPTERAPSRTGTSPIAQ